MKKKLLGVVLAVTMVVSLGACGKSNTETPATEPEVKEEAAEQESESTPKASSDKEIVIGVCIKTLSDEFPRQIADAIENAAAGMDNVKVEINDAQADVATQLEQVENLIAKGVDAIILNPQEADGLNTAVEACVAAGIPVIECNTMTSNEDYNCYVGSSDVVSGRMQGEFIKEAIGGKGQIAIMEGVMGQTGQINRLKGVYESLVDVCPDVEVVAEQTANWQRDEAMALAENWIVTYPELKAIMCQNDDMALGALEAVKNAGKQDSILVVGVDAITEAVEAVQSGELACTVFQDAVGQGEGALNAAIAIVNGETVEKTIDIPFVLVTKENAADYL